MEKRPLLTIFTLIMLLPALAGAQASANPQKKSLEEINRQLEDKKRELDLYRAEEERIVTEISGLKKEEKQTASRRAELEGQLER